MKTITRVKTYTHICRKIRGPFLHAVYQQHLNRKEGICMLKRSPLAKVTTLGLWLPVGRLPAKKQWAYRLINVM